MLYMTDALHTHLCFSFTDLHHRFRKSNLAPLATFRDWWKCWLWWHPLETLSAFVETLEDTLYQIKHTLSLWWHSVDNTRAICWHSCDDVLLMTLFRVQHELKCEVSIDYAAFHSTQLNSASQQLKRLFPKSYCLLLFIFLLAALAI